MRTEDQKQIKQRETLQAVFWIRIGSGSGLDPDPDWIRSQSGQWIRIRTLNPHPDLGGQK
jgi:hypothetical protein